MKTIIAGNWKMNLNLESAKELAAGIKNGLKSTVHEILVFPSDLHVPAVADILKDTGVKIGVQNFYPSAPAAFTGETSVEQARDFGVTHLLIGHSERRQFLGEDNKFCNEKIIFAIAEKMTPVYCIGETLEEREAGKTMDVVKKQITEGLAGISAEDASKIVLAYEPVWAIGTGKVATPEQAEEVHEFIREHLTSMYNESVSGKIPVLYGGSVKPDNIQSLMAKENINGGLVGGASLVADSFLALL